MELEIWDISIGWAALVWLAATVLWFAGWMLANRLRVKRKEKRNWRYQQLKDAAAYEREQERLKKLYGKLEVE